MLTHSLKYKIEYEITKSQNMFSHVITDSRHGT